MTRRELLVGGLIGLPWWRRKEVKACGARFRRIRKGSGSRRYLLIHGDESTAREVLAEHMDHTAGDALLIQNDVRTLRAPNGLEYDPNRMFSREGLAANLVRLNPSATEAQREAVLRLVERDRGRLLGLLTPPRNGVLFALHNNARGYSVKDEVDISDAVALPAPEKPNEFMLCSSQRDFELLRTGPYNVVLQENPKGEEDGSLSRLAAKRRIRYVNIEAFLGREAEQKAMLEWVEQRLPQ